MPLVEVDRNTPGLPSYTADNMQQWELNTVPVRHPGRWIAVCAIIGALLWLTASLARNEVFHFSAVPKYLLSPAIMRGVLITIELTIASEVIGIVIGVLVAMGRTSGDPLLSALGWFYVWFFRGTPVLVQLVFWYNLSIVFQTFTIAIPGGPILLSVPTNAVITAFTAALLGLGLNEGAYMAEIVRGGLLAVDPGQSEAAQALGFGRLQNLRTVVLPQALRVIVPPTGNQLISMLKTTALVSVIAGGDLLTNAENLYSMNFYVLELLVVASLWYLALTSIASGVQHVIERRLTGVKETRGARPRWFTISRDERASRKG